MAKRGKNYLAASPENRSGQRTPEEAVSIAKEGSYAKFDETVELHLLTSADPRQADQQLREVTSLPHGTGRQTRVLAFVDGEVATAALEAGADMIADDDIVKRIENGWSEFEVAIATPDQMGKIGRLGRYLGRKGLMPNPRTGTVVQPQDIGKAIDESKKGRIELRMDSTGIIHTIIGKVSFEEKQLMENLSTVVNAITQAKPEGVKGQFIKSATLSTTMGPGLKLDLSSLLQVEIE